jgi:hypothetical protein
VPAVLAAAFAGWSAGALPFYPSGWAAAIAVAAGAATLLRERLGLAIALAAPVLPLGNLGRGLALAYVVVALVWFAVFAREPRGGLFAALGPPLALVGALPLLPLALSGLRSPLRRALACLGAFATAAVAAGLHGVELPLTGEPSHGSLGLARVQSATRAASTLWDEALAYPSLAAAAVALALAAAALPYARSRGRWAIAGWGASTLAATLLAAPDVHALPVVVCVWVTCLILWAGPLVTRAGDRRPAS